MSDELTPGKFTTYEIKGKRGIDDLQTTYAFHGNSQGDEGRSNLVEDYVAAKGWMSNVFDVDPTDQKAILIESKRREVANAEYVTRLHAEGKFGEEYLITMQTQYNSAFDDPIDGPEFTNHGFIVPNGLALENYKMVFLDFKDDKNE